MIRICLLLALGSLASRPTFAQTDTGGFSFTAPPGWSLISAASTDEERRRAPSAIAEAWKTGRYVFVATEPTNEQSVGSTMNAIVRTGARPPDMTSETLEQLAQQIATQLAQSGMTYRLLRRELVKVAGATAIHFVAEVDTPAGHRMMVQYAIPGRRSLATLTFSTTVEKFAQNEPIFARAAEATKGAVDPERRWLAIWRDAPRDAVLGASAVALALIVKRLLTRKRPS